jgi:signal transduction histidine kinase
MGESQASTEDGEAREAHKPARLRQDYRGALGRVAHDIRSATGVAWTAITEIERGTQRESGEPSGLESYLRIGQRSLRRLLFLADRLTLAGAIEEGDFELATCEIKVGELLKTVVDDVSFALGRRSVEVILEPPDPTLAVSADGRWLSAALAELIGNAIRFAKSRATIRASSDGKTVSLFIEDDGPGLPPAAVASLTDGCPTPEGTHGLGLSLPLAHRVVGAHGGHIRAGAKPADRGPGTLIVVNLPRRERSSSP